MDSIPPSGPSFRTRCMERLDAVVSDAAGEPPLFTPLDISRCGPNAEARLVVRLRCHPRLPDPDECEMAVLELLYLRGRTREGQIVSVLEDRFSANTIRRRLKRLVRLKVLTRRRETPRGYNLDTWLRFSVDSRTDGLP